MTVFYEFIYLHGFRVGPSEIFGLLLLGMCFCIAIAPEPLLKSAAMVTVGLMVGTLGLDVNTGVIRTMWGLGAYDDSSYEFPVKGVIMVFGYLLPCVIRSAQARPGQRPFTFWWTVYSSLVFLEAWPVLFLLWLHKVPKRCSAPIAVTVSALLAQYFDFPLNDWPVYVGLVLLGVFMLQSSLSWVPVVIGFTLSGLTEENLRRAMLLARGDWAIFFERSISGGLIAIALMCLATSVYVRLRSYQRRASA